MCAITGTCQPIASIDLHLARGVVQVIVAADDMGDAHVVIVDHHGQHVGGVAVGAQQHQVVELLVLPDHVALHLIVDHGFAGLRRLEADDGLDPGRRSVGSRSRQRPS